MGENNDFPDPREAGPDRRDNVASAGLDPDTWDDLEAWRTDRRLKRSEATRQLIRQALYGDERDTVRLGAAVAGIAFIAASAAGEAAPTATTIVGGAYIAGTLIWSAWPSVTRRL